ncbi:citrate/2-methylcitrate synthase [Shigella flexneri]
MTCILLHRGFPIDQLATESNYLEVCYILLNGEKPTQAQYDEFKTTVTRHTMIHEDITRLSMRLVVTLTDGWSDVRDYRCAGGVYHDFCT